MFFTGHNSFSAIKPLPNQRKSYGGPQDVDKSVKKRRLFALKEKTTIIKRTETGESVTARGHHYQVSESTVRIYLQE